MSGASGALPTAAPPPQQLASDQVKRKAVELGFAACGVTTPAPSERADAFDAWLARGYAGTMRYLHRQAKRRRDPRLIVPEARSVVVVLDNYYVADRDVDRLPPRIAKYARGEDYHRATMRRLEHLSAFLTENGARLARTYSDAGPVPERELAQRAGLGWIGKNTMLIQPGAGSFFFIGSIFTDLELLHDLPYELDRCGSCTRCIEACPTGAIVEPRVLDATRCISYLTIEQKGPIAEELVPHLEGWAFGCDICNDVCPWNLRFAEETSRPEFQPRDDLAKNEPGFFDDMSDDEFTRRYGDRPFERPGLAGMQRNLKAVFRHQQQR